MSIEETRDFLNEDAPFGEFYIEKENLYFFYDFGSVEEPGDVSWDLQCEISEYVHEKLNIPVTEEAYFDNWADNDSLGFKVKT